MPCYHPLRAWRAKREGPEGQRGITFSLNNASVTEPVTVPCGKCIGCRLLKSRGWSLRCQHEASLHLLNCAITLTYKDDKVLSLSKRDFQLFMKRLRKFIEPVRISYYACGEYGEARGRPHYHALLFGMDFLDKKAWKSGTAGSEQFVSPTLDKLWPHGYATVGNVSPQSAAYVCGYVRKKLWKVPDAVDEDGVISSREPEFHLMSVRPAIGKAWIQKFLPDVYPDDFCVSSGKEVAVPRYYDSQLKDRDPTLYAAIKAERLGAMLSDDAWKDSKPSRLAVREVVAKAKAALQKGSL